MPTIIKDTVPVSIVNGFSREPVKFVQSFTRKIEDWLETRPNLSEDAKSSLAGALLECAEQYKQIAQAIIDYKG
jgi:hypothetical protein